MAAPAWLPTHDDLAKLLAGQTVGTRGDSTPMSGNFGKTTGVMPTDKQPFATAAIDLAYRKPLRIIGPTPAPTPQAFLDLIDDARNATLAKAAAHFVSAAYSDQATEGQRSRAEEYWSRIADELLVDLADAATDLSDGDEPGAGDNVGPGRVAGFFRPSKLVDCYGRPRVL